MKNRIVLLYFFLTFSFVVSSQNSYKYGHIPFIRNFSANEYKGVAQNWCITQNDQNFIFVGNGSSILMYDGVNWHNTKLSRGQAARSFVKDEEGTIYVGGDNEFGKIIFTEQGDLSYQKLSDSTQEYGKLWGAYSLFDRLLLISKTKIIQLKNDSVVSIIKSKPQTQFDKTIPYKDKIIFYIVSKKDTNKYCTVFDGENFTPIENSSFFLPKVVFSIRNIDYIIDKYGEIRELTEYNGKYRLISTGKRLGDYKKAYGKEPLFDLDINTITVTKKMIAVGTDGTGIYLFDLKGNLIRIINKTDGLTNQQIRALHFDQYNNLWSANDNEIFLIDLSNPITFFENNDGINSSIEDIDFDDNNDILISSHIDLLTHQLKDDRLNFKSTEAFQMDVFQLKEFTFSDSTKKTLVIANNGVYEYNKDKDPLLISDMYAWDLHQSESNPNRIWVGLDGDGIGSLIYNPATKRVKLEQYNYPNTFGEVRKVVEKDGNVYYTVKDGGIALFDTTKQQQDNYLTGLINYEDSKYSQFYLYNFYNEVFVGTDNGVYIIENNHLISFKEKYKSNYFNKKNLYIHRLYNNKNDEKLWFVIFHNSSKENEKIEVGYIEFFNDSIKLTTNPLKTIQEGIHSIQTDKEGIVWFGGVKKLYAYNPNVDITNFDSTACYISRIMIKDSVISSFVNYNHIINPNIDYSFNSITFKFTSPSYVGGAQNLFSTYLEGIDEHWSDWSTDNIRTYPRLDNGKYTFKVKSKNFYGQESKAAIFSFTILPPWYKTWWAFLLYFLIAIALIYIIIRISLKRVQEQNAKLEKIVDERTAEVELQKHEIEEKNKDIVDSIKYAKRIQNTILPSNERMDEILKDYFVIYKPKDIVSGDFYWADLLDGKSYFSAIDCTGHGVPGAFVSIVGFNGLKRTVNEFKVREPGKILDTLTDIVVDTFTASESHLKDGMDLSLCSLDYQTLTLEYAGANNSLVIIRDGEIIEIKANKQPIGEFDNRVPFTNHSVQLQKGDCIFLFSDGYADQFGGPKGKKFKLKTLKNLFVSIAHLSPKEQKEKLEKAFYDWKGEIEQLDDVCLIGVKI